MLWSEKHEPQNFNKIIGQQAPRTTLFEWLVQWQESHVKIDENMTPRWTPHRYGQNLGGYIWAAAGERDAGAPPEDRPCKFSFPKSEWAPGIQTQANSRLAMLIGPNGVGKTLTAELCLKALGYQYAILSMAQLWKRTEEAGVKGFGAKKTEVMDTYRAL